MTKDPLDSSSSSSHSSSQEVLRVLTSKPEIKAFYNKISRVYDFLAERSEQPMRQAGLRLLAAQPGETVLELGSGTGHCLLDLAAAVGGAGTVLGVDLSDGMLHQTQILLSDSELAPRVKLINGDAEALPLRTGELDAIFMSFTLELFDNPHIPRVLAECARVLRPDGRLVVVGMSKEGAEKQLRVKTFEWAHRHFPNFLDCRPIFVRRALEEAGWRVERSALDHLWVPVELVLGRPPAQA